MGKVIRITFRARKGWDANHVSEFLVLSQELVILRGQEVILLEAPLQVQQTGNRDMTRSAQLAGHVLEGETHRIASTGIPGGRGCEGFVQPVVVVSGSAFVHLPEGPHCEAWRL